MSPRETAEDELGQRNCPVPKKLHLRRNCLERRKEPLQTACGDQVLKTSLRKSNEPGEPRIPAKLKKATYKRSSRILNRHPILISVQAIRNGDIVIRDVSRRYIVIRDVSRRYPIY